MKKIALIAAASCFALALAACGDADDASEDAMADNVEMPADAAMAGTPDPAVDAVDEAAEEATAEAEAAIEQTAEQAADDAEAAVADIEAAAAADETPANEVPQRAAHRSGRALALLASGAGALALAACGEGDNDPGPGGVTVGEARALDEAAEMLEQQRLPEEAQPAAGSSPTTEAAAAADER